ncbi:MAG: fumarate hydratase C-terminal domain-containing protein [Pseudomonadota bacterium]
MDNTITSTSGGLKQVELALPASREDLAALELGNVVYLTGRIFTAREGVYKRAVEEGHGLPAPPAELGSANFHCSPAAAIAPDGTPTVGAVTATASFRFAKWLEGWFALSGCNIIIGKGGMSGEIYRSTFVPANAVYLTTVGYGTGALLGRGIKNVVATHWRDELGLAQAIWVLDVERMGPFLVEGDLTGTSLFERENAKVAAGIEAAYEGTRPATMQRYGELDDKTREVI